jgi:hypothetical protein
MPRLLNQRIDALLKVGHREKVLRADASHSFGVMLLGTLRASFLREQYGAPPMSTSAAVDAVCDFFLRGAGR